MMSRRILAGLGALLILVTAYQGVAQAKALALNARSAILVDMNAGKVLFEQNADAPIAPASITKVLSLFIVFDAIREGRVHLSDSVYVSSRAANMSGSRMGLRAGTHVPLQELIKGMAVVSGNDACVAVAEYLSGDVETFVRRMNAKARELGMYNTLFMTPNGLPAKGQLTTARDIAKLSMAYLRRYPESLSIHSMTCYTYGSSTHSNANRLLGRCPGVDGLKTGFVCASGYNISATAKRGDTRLLAVVMGCPSAGIRIRETEKLIEAGFRTVSDPSEEIRLIEANRQDVQLARSLKPSHAREQKASIHKLTNAAQASCGIKPQKAAEDSCLPGKKHHKKSLATKVSAVEQSAPAKQPVQLAKKSATVKQAKIEPTGKLKDPVNVKKGPAPEKASSKTHQAATSKEIKKSVKGDKMSGASSQNEKNTNGQKAQPLAQVSRKKPT